MIDIYADGSCLDNQGDNPRGGAGYVAVRGTERVDERSEFVGHGSDVTNNTAEYDAVLGSLQWREENAPNEAVRVHTDSRLVVKQVAGEWSCNEEHLAEKIEAVRDRMDPEDEVVEAEETPHVARAHDLAQAGARDVEPPDTSPDTRRRSTSSGGSGVTEIDLDPADEVPGPVEQPHPGFVPRAVPDELKRRPQWINWVPDERNGDSTKIPWKGWDNEVAKSNDADTFTDFETAVGAVGEWAPFGDGSVPGVGFVLTTGDPYCVLDLDDCRNGHTGEVDQWAKYVVHSLDSYCQISVSGTGLHIFLRDATRPEWWKDKKDHEKEMEMYDWGRFITMTGHLYEEPFDEIRSVEDFGSWAEEIEHLLYE